MAGKATCGHCRDCRWWEGPNGPVGWGECLIVRDDGYNADAVMRESSAVVYALDGERTHRPPGMRGLLRTAPDFGCLQWQRKEV